MNAASLTLASLGSPPTRLAGVASRPSILPFLLLFLSPLSPSLPRLAATVARSNAPFPAPAKLTLPPLRSLAAVFRGQPPPPAVPLLLATRLIHIHAVVIVCRLPAGRHYYTSCLRSRHRKTDSATSSSSSSSFSSFRLSLPLTKVDSREATLGSPSRRIASRLE